MFAQASAQGSPPRMRGKVHQLREAAQFGGITPAYAGKRWTRLPSRAAMRDHPRVCGEKTAEQFKAEYPQGSPPRMRGKVTATPANAGATGITPAYAGKRKFKPKKTTDDWDHPRVCGEKYQDKNGNKRTAGITPAYAGKSTHGSAFSQRRRDHPRVCGEKPSCAMLTDLFIGSPPRMRGKGKQRCQAETDVRITPAYAGKRVGD